VASWTRPEGLNTIFDALQEVDDEAFVDVMEGIQEVLDDAAAIAAIVDAVMVTDPLSAILALAANELNKFVTDIAAADIYVLPLMPKTWGDLLRPYSMTRALSDLSASISDVRDPNRPTASTSSAFASFTVVVGANNWQDFTQFIQLFGEIFDGTEFNRWSNLINMRFNFDQYAPIPRPNRNSQGVPWDWTRTNWIDHLPAIGRAIETAQDWINSLAGVGSGLALALRELIENLRKRIAFIRAVFEELARIAELIRRWKELFPEIYYLFAASAPGDVGSPGGVEGYVSTVVNAGNQPDFKLVGGLTFVAFGPDARANINTVATLIGLKVTEVEIAEDRIEEVVEE